MTDINKFDKFKQLSKNKVMAISPKGSPVKFSELTENLQRLAFKKYETNLNSKKATDKPINEFNEFIEIIKVFETIEKEKEIIKVDKDIKSPPFYCKIPIKFISNFDACK